LRTTWFDCGVAITYSTKTAYPNPFSTIALAFMQR
jgi:hypothetical protein